MRISIAKACLGLAVLFTTSATASAEKSYLCAINEVFECVAVTGCSRISLEEANLASVMVLDVEKKTLSSAPLGQEAFVDPIDGVTVTDEVILLHGVGPEKPTDRIWSALVSLKTGALTAGMSTPDATLAMTGNCTVKP